MDGVGRPLRLIPRIAQGLEPEHDAGSRFCVERA
jgi:hypothetical protein